MTQLLTVVWPSVVCAIKRLLVSCSLKSVRDTKIVTRHLIPNAIGPVIIYVTLTVPKVILLESFLSFLGLGVQEPLTSWGVLISEGVDMMESAPWMLLVPSFFLAATLFCLNFLGDGLRDALDPRTR